MVDAEKRGTLIIAIVALGLLALGLRLGSLGLDDLKPWVALRFPEVRWVTPQTVAGWMKSEEAPILLDARTEEEFDVSHLRGAIRIDPRHPNIDELSLPADRPIVVYCSVGYRSASVIESLGAKREIYNLEGGIFGWAREDRPLFRGAQRVDEVHPYDWAWGRFLDESHRAPRGAAQ